MARIKTKFLEGDAVDDSKVRLRNNQNLRARNAANSADVSILKLNASDVIELASLALMPGTATSANHLVNLATMEAAINGVRDMKQGVRVASVANVDISSAPAAIDGVTLAAGDRVLLKDQTTGSENGIRVFTAAAAALARSSDADASAEVTQGMATLVAEGTVNARKLFQLVTSDPITLDTTALVFQETPTATSYTGGDMIALSGTVFSVDLAASSGLESTNAGNAAGQLRVKASGAGAVKDRTIALNGSNEVAGLLAAKETFTLGAGDITNQYVDLAKIAHESSIMVTVSGIVQTEGTDYTLNYTGGAGGNTRITFDGELATGGAAELVATDVLRVSYQHLL